ncbi:MULTISPECIES: HAD family hydrolase [Enterococcus]|uniref:HAD family hydrolase n=1 Tax=Enterococcus TaxID=1350 RepID=UPI0010F756A1|nr:MULTISPECIES: HAD family hydrolase [Enterococcus]KAF1304251.1 hypothetical protein BAU16_02565 [Enterococcus sp. JM9B]
MDLLKRYNTFIFDFDGTLADTLPICFESFRQVFIKYNGVSLSNQTIESWFGPSEAGIIKNNLTNPDAFSDALALYYSIYQQEHSKFVKENPEITAMLAKLSASKKNIAVVTGKGRISYDISMQCLGLKKVIAFSVTGDDVIQPKPHQEGILKALDYFQAKTETAVYFGDSNADIQAANNAQVYSIGVKWFYPRSFSYQPDRYSFVPMDIF